MGKHSKHHDKHSKHDDKHSNSEGKFMKGYFDLFKISLDIVKIYLDWQRVRLYRERINLDKNRKKSDFNKYFEPEISDYQIDYSLDVIKDFINDTPKEASFKNKLLRPNFSNLEIALNNEIQKYSKATDGFVDDVLNGKNFQGSFGSIAYHNKIKYKPSMSLVTSIKDIVASALKNCENTKNKGNIEQLGSTFVFGDVHAQLDLLIQNLYMAGIIDNNGVLTTQSNKKIVFLGDYIEKGPFNIETLIYLRMLQTRAKEANNEFVTIMGNHELKLINTYLADRVKVSTPESSYQNTLAMMLISDVKNDNLPLSFTSNEDKLFCLHGGLEKITLLKSLIAMSNNPEYADKFKNNKKNLYETFDSYLKKSSFNWKNLDKIEYKKLSTLSSSENIYSIMSNSKITYKDLTEWMNNSLKKTINTAVFSNAPIDKSNNLGFLLIGENSILDTRKKGKNISNPERGINNKEDFLINSTEKKYSYKPVIISGHTRTGSKEVVAYGFESSIKQNKSNIFTDVSLTAKNGGQQAFLVANSQTGEVSAVEVRQVQIMQKGLDKNFTPIELSKKIENLRTRKLEGINIKINPKINLNIPM